MPNDLELERLAELGAISLEQFEADNQAMHKAWREGTLDKWLEARLIKERSDGRPAATEPA